MSLDTAPYVAVCTGVGYWEVRRYTGELMCGVKVTELVCMLPFGPQVAGRNKARAERIARLLNEDEERSQS